MMNKTLTATLTVLMLALPHARAQNAWSSDYNTPFGSNVTFSSTTPVLISTNEPTSVSRTICWQGSGLLIITETNTLPVIQTTTNGYLKGGTNFVTVYPGVPVLYVTNSLAGATNFVVISTSPTITGSDGDYPISSGQCYQTSMAGGLFRGMLLIRTTGAGTVYFAGGKNQQ